MARYKATLAENERDELLSIIGKGKRASQKYRNAYVLLNCDEGEHSEKVTNAEISKVLKVGMRTIDRIKKRFVEEGFGACLVRKQAASEYERKAGGDFEARLIALGCGEPPGGFSRWSLRLLADKTVELEIAGPVSRKTVRSVLKKRLEAPEGQRVGGSPGTRW